MAAPARATSGKRLHRGPRNLPRKYSQIAEPFEKPVDQTLEELVVEDMILIPFKVCTCDLSEPPAAHGFETGFALRAHCLDVCERARSGVR